MIRAIVIAVVAVILQTGCSPSFRSNAGNRTNAAGTEIVGVQHVIRVFLHDWTHPVVGRIDASTVDGPVVDTGDGTFTMGLWAIEKKGLVYVGRYTIEHGRGSTVEVCVVVNDGKVVNTEVRQYESPIGVRGTENTAGSE